ncbi:aminomethyl-transferring glycine dehydrogenase, partial [Candidatus Bathyarchaeota archaeon]|nr:aminomethyl-transferring glycine dehydrogenase [Candidatus Bathyarchaeota archaeon]
TSKSLQEISRELLKHGIVGGKPLIREFPELGQTSLLCVTEMHTLQDIERLHGSLEDILEA